MVDESMALSLEDKAKLILENRKNSNYLVDLLAVLESSKEEDILEAISCLKNVFKVFILRREWYEVFRPGFDDDEGEVKPGENLKDDNSENAVDRAGGDSKKDAEKIFAEWLHEKYLLFLKTLLRFFAHFNKDVAKASLECLMQFLKAEHKAKSSGSNHDANKSYFPNMLFGRITSALVTAEYADKNNLLKKFETYCGYLDIQFYTLKNLKSFLNNKLGKEESTNNNICSLLLKITAAGKDADEIETKLFIPSQAPDKQKFSWESKKKRNLFSDAWLSFLQTQLPQESLKKVLLNLHEGIMPLMENPKLLIDFLTDAYDMEGPLALLALNGLFILIQQYNLAYPDFFKKLYRLLDSKVFNLNYRSRFFTLTDLFLTSVNLPSYMVAAFAKRLARLSLTASPDGIIIILALIENLMKRHPSCRVLIHRKVNAAAYL